MQVAESKTPKAMRQTESMPQARTVVPPMDIYETDDGLELIADLPGVAAGGLEIDLDEDVLTIRGHVSRNGTGTARAIYAEAHGGDFCRAFGLNGDIDRDRIEAVLKDGVLRLHLPKAARAKTRRIEVKAS